MMKFDTVICGGMSRLFTEAFVKPWGSEMLQTYRNPEFRANTPQKAVLPRATAIESACSIRSVYIDHD
jgi:hypothetical protein